MLSRGTFSSTAPAERGGDVVDDRFEFDFGFPAGEAADLPGVGTAAAHILEALGVSLLVGDEFDRRSAAGPGDHQFRELCIFAADFL